MYLGTLPEEFGARDAVVMGGSGASLTFAELERRSVRIARAFDAWGLQPGDHVALLLRNELELFPVVWAAQRSGLLHTPVNWHLGVDEAAYVVDNCEARVLFCSAGLAELAEQVRARTPRIERTVVTGAGAVLSGSVALDDLMEQWSADPRVEEIEGHPMLYSSGTTGRPKGIVPELDRSPFGTGLAIDQMVRGLFGLDDTAVYLSPGPLYHAAPLAWSMGAARNGATTVVMESFDAEEVLRLIDRHHVTHAQFVPTMFVRMLKLSEDVRRRYDVSSLRQVVHAAAPCPPAVKEAMIAWFGPVLTEYYAGSEVNGFCTLTTDEWLEHRGSVGRPVLGEVHILDPLGHELPVGEVGEVWFGGTRRFEYHGDADKTAAAFNDRGWSTLGDLGRVDEDGYLYLADRRTDLIISGGVNVYPREVEDVLCMHPEVADVAVIGVPDADLGHHVHAVIEAQDTERSETELAAALDAFVRERLAGFKVPRSYAFDRIPRLPSGKILRRVLIESHAGMADAERSR